MTNPIQSRLLIVQQLDRLIKQGDALHLGVLQRTEISDDDYAAVVNHYHGWYEACLSIVPEDLQHAFRDSYTDVPLQPKLQTYLKHAREPNPTPKPESRNSYWSPWKYRFDATFHSLYRKQQDVLWRYRERLLDIPSAVPRDLKDMFANIFSGKSHSVLTVDGLFMQAGAQRDWWVQPIHRSGLKRDRARGWFTGIQLYAPEREVEIAKAVCRTALQQGLVNSAVGKRMEELLTALPPSEPSAPMPTAAHPYIAPQRLAELRQLPSGTFDLTKLIRLCEELNIAMEQQQFFAAAMLTRALIDHVPPVFGATSFKEMVATHGTKSLKEAMQKLDDSVRKIADAHLHTHIRTKEVLPTWQQVNVGTLLDVLLGEIVRVLK
jgi:hypothetical protein